MISLNKILDDLKRTNPNGFVNETHFQIEFGYAFKRTYPAYDLIFEWANDNMRVDLIAKNNEEAIGFEFKYFTKESVVKLKFGLKVQLKYQLARDLHRIGFWKDVSKLEGLKSKNLIKYGYCLFLTNDEKVFSPIKPSNNDIDYDVSDGIKPGKCNLVYRGKHPHNVILVKNNYALKHKQYNSNGFYLLDLLIN